MCYSALVRREVKALQRRFGIVVRTDLDEYIARHHLDPKGFPALEDRIYAGRFAPIITADGAATHMRYSAFPPAYIENPKGLTTFNARRDNLDSPFWRGAFGEHHGLIMLRGFYEWVSVKDLLSARVIKLPDVQRVFEAQKDARAWRLLEAGRPCKPTKTEQTDPRFRKIVIEFAAPDYRDLLVPVIFNRG